MSTPYFKLSSIVKPLTDQWEDHMLNLEVKRMENV